jgi:hypothetical protein
VAPNEGGSGHGVEESIIIDRPAEEVSVAGPMVIHTACMAEPAGSGCRASVLYEPERLPGGVVGKLTAPLTARIVRRSFRADLARLKDIFEAEAEITR